MNFQTPQEMDIVKDIKETMCYIVGDYDAAMKQSTDNNAADKNYELPDGKQIVVGNERFRCTEALFRPELIKPDCAEGVHKLTYDTIMKCHQESSVRNAFFGNIILSGGSTLFEGMSERMQSEMNKLSAQAGYKAKVLAPPERLYSVWLGGSILASLSTFKTMWITKQEYDEQGGARYIHDKCF